MSDFGVNKWRSLLRGGAASFFLLLLLGPWGCAAGHQKAASPAESAAKIPDVVVTRLELAGVRGGAEICFNALDDNGNRLIDEGCGVPQGQLQVALAWATLGADVDLYVSDPKGEIADYESATDSGLTGTPDCPNSESDCHSQNFEIVYLEEADALPGKYQVRVRLEKLPLDAKSLSANLSIRTPEGTTSYQLEFFREAQEAQLAFEVRSDKKSLEKKK